MLEARCRVLPFSFFYPSPEGGRGENTQPPPPKAGGQLVTAPCAQQEEEGWEGSRGCFTYKMSGVGHSGKLFAFPTSTLGKMGLKGIPQRCPFPVPLVTWCGHANELKKVLLDGQRHEQKEQREGFTTPS
ncbi:uncharacterized protein TM35_000941060 [Trypanosoma theileri]|uniref:Uncharacterized protein n=1 Tax=Trypanosoma theileri TaxID=67003 RepID=A0A1X0NF78_9TRYP|nr:uncharacterized protein TM35_000941060 [Trypanosoma theileri]ORC82256.1 hypothetical protein TM35_000941060 [Trypanosoma theileri]